MRDLDRRSNGIGLHYLRARYYDPTTAQFLSRDPAVAKTRSPYGYAMGSPLNRVDPSGLLSQSDLSSDQIAQLKEVCSHQHFAACQNAAFCADQSSCANLQQNLNQAADRAECELAQGSTTPLLATMAKEFRIDAEAAGISAEYYTPDRTGAFVADVGEGTTAGWAMGAAGGCVATIWAGCWEGAGLVGGIGAIGGAIGGGIFGLATGKDVAIPFSTEIDVFRTASNT